MRFLIGNGKSVSAWEDNWLPVYPPRPPRVQNNHQGPEDSVNSSMINGMNKWDIEKVHKLIKSMDVEAVLRIKLNGRDDRDYLGWQYTEEGVYTVKFGCWLATYLPSDQNPINPPAGNVVLKQSIWKLHTAPKLKHF